MRRKLSDILFGAIIALSWLLVLAYILSRLFGC